MRCGCRYCPWPQPPNTFGLPKVILGYCHWHAPSTRWSIFSVSNRKTKGHPMGGAHLRVRESICIFHSWGMKNKGVAAVETGGEQQSTGLLYLDGFDSRPAPKKDTTRWVVSFFGAGYGNRTRLHGLGSRCITDIRTLHCGVIIADGT